MLGYKKTDTITIKDVPAEAFIKAFAEQLKVEQKVTPLPGDEYVKTGKAKEISPHNQDWFYIRTAALARKIFLKPQSGVGRFKAIFGEKMRNGQGRNHHVEGSGKVIRYALQQLEKANFLMKLNDKRNKNASKVISQLDNISFARVVTFDGQRVMNEVAKKVYQKLNN